MSSVIAQQLRVGQCYVRVCPLGHDATPAAAAAAAVPSTGHTRRPSLQWSHSVRKICENPCIRSEILTERATILHHARTAGYIGPPEHDATATAADADAVCMFFHKSTFLWQTLLSGSGAAGGGGGGGNPT